MPYFDFDSAADAATPGSIEWEEFCDDVEATEAERAEPPKDLLDLFLERMKDAEE